jgi:hypothetical protein
LICVVRIIVIIYIIKIALILFFFSICFVCFFSFLCFTRSYLVIGLQVVKLTWKQSTELLLKYFSSVVRFGEIFNNIAFSHILTSRPGLVIAPTNKIILMLSSDIFGLPSTGFPTSFRIRILCI